VATRPSGPVVLGMVWHDLLFAHWPVHVDALRPHIPTALSIDTFDGSAWVGVVPFRMSRVRPLRVPLPGERFRFGEINVRTYVTHGDRPGVWFFSLDAADPLAVWAARTTVSLPYAHGDVRADVRGDEVTYRSHVAGPPARTFRARYRPTGPVEPAPPGSLASFLTDRLCLYSADRRGRVRRADIEHPAWPLQPGEAEIETDTMTAAHGIVVPDTAPHLLFAKRLEVVARWPATVAQPPRPKRTG
jgi:uncharacterized protein